MAIRPVDLQGAIFQQQVQAGATQRAEQAPQLAAQLQQAAFVEQLEERQESVQETDESQGGRINAKEERKGDGQHQPGERRQRSALEEVIDDAAGLPDSERHLIDFTA